MKFLPVISLSWKNVWRNPVRSGVVIAAVTLGTWAGIFSTALMSGLSYQYIRNQLNLTTAHLQIHNASYLEENLPSKYIQEPSDLEQKIRNKPFVRQVAARSVVAGLAASASNTYGVTIKGINPSSDTLISTLHTFIEEGEYLYDNGKNPVLVGTELADRLDLKLGSRLVLNFQDIEGNLTAGVFRVIGLSDTHDANFDKNYVFVLQEDLNSLLGREGTVHEIVVMVDDFKQADAYAGQISEDPALRVQSWGDVSPTLRYTDSNVDLMLYIFMTIIVIALTFGIINTMLMAVLERTQELGMLMAIGVNKVRTFLMVMLETIFMTLVGVPVGMMLSWLSITWLAQHGLNVSMFAEGFEMFGMSTVIYPELPPGYYLNIGLLMVFATLISSVYPSIKALRLNPVEAIRKV